MRFLKFPALLAAAILLAGCAGYHLGPVNGESAGDKTVQVMPFNNQTLQPRLGDAVTQALRERLQTDGTYRLSNSSGDIVITGEITSYIRIGMSFANSDVLTASNYRVEVEAVVTARERGTGKLLLDKKKLKGYTFVNVGSDLASAERQAMPLLAQNLAQNVTQTLTEGAW